MTDAYTIYACENKGFKTPGPWRSNFPSLDLALIDTFRYWIVRVTSLSLLTTFLRFGFQPLSFVPNFWR